MNLRTRFALSSLSLSLFACSPPPVAVPDAAGDGAVAQPDATASDAPSSPDASASMDATSTADSGGVCSFNRECPSSDRCECSERDGCRCTPGARGTRTFGQPCASGNECASALCVEGPTGASLCSDECTSAAQCSGELPRCISVPIVGMFCARNPPDAGAMEAGAPRDASVTTEAGTCAGACATTALTATFGMRTAMFDRAQHGISGTDGIYIEAHFGGSPECPSMTSPTPDRTLVIANLRDTGDMRAQTYADGVRATLLDFRSTLTMRLPLGATDVRVTPRFVSRGTAVSYEFTATFAGGTITGTLFAPRCTSLDG